MSLTLAAVMDALRSVRYPGFSRDIVTLGVTQDVAVKSGRVRLRLQPGPGDPAVVETIERDVRRRWPACPDWSTSRWSGRRRPPASLPCWASGLPWPLPEASTKDSCPRSVT